MLSKLVIENVALIDRLIMEFARGFNVMTGETGAGKSIIIDAVNLALGERASREFIRSGKDKAKVEATFEDVSNVKLSAILDENLIDAQEDGSLLLCREVSASGKSVCRVNGTVVPLAVQKRISDALVDIHGQHEHQALLDPETHIDFLDSYSGDTAAALKNDIKELYAQHSKLTSMRHEGFMSEAERERELDILNFQINEITQAQLKDGEETELEAEKKKLANAETIAVALNGVSVCLSGDEEALAGALSEVKEAQHRLESVEKYDPDYAGAAKRLANMYYELEDLSYSIRDMEALVHPDPERLNEIEERLEQLSRLKRKYGGTIEAVSAYLADSKSRLEAILGMEERRGRLDAELKDCEKRYAEKAKKLTDVRKKAAKQLEVQLMEQLKELGLASARVAVEIKSDDYKDVHENGADTAEFMLSANPGEPLKPLIKVASGGEISRIMLAFKAIFAKLDCVSTMIFDEIDTGISGAAAATVGEKMLNIAKEAQVICITHLPQIAALADVHFMVKKETDGKSTNVHVEKLSRDERVKGLADMMDGGSGSKHGLEHSLELIVRAESMKQSPK